MNHPTRLRFSRIMLLGLTLINLALMLLAFVGLQSHFIYIVAISGLGLLLLTAALLLLFRQWLHPSYLEFQPGRIEICWNNWHLSGVRRGVEITTSRPRFLTIAMADPKIGVCPVGPIHLLASIILRPLLSFFLPEYLSRIYYLTAKDLALNLPSTAEGMRMKFPLIFFGRRRAKHVLEKNME